MAELILTILLMLLSTGTASIGFAKYKHVDAYEVRPGVLMMPRYASDGEVCEVGIERRLYSPGRITLDSDLSQDVIDQIIDELAPADERGPKMTGLGDSMIQQGGNSILMTTEYTNVTTNVYAKASGTSSANKTVVDEVVATIKWKNRQCI